MANDYILIATVLKPQGIRGEVKAKPYTADPERFRSWNTLYRETLQGMEPLPARCTRIHEGFVYLILQDASTGEEAEAFRGLQLYVHRRDVPAAADDTAVLICDLVGCRGVTVAGDTIGTLTEVLQHGPVDVYVFRTPQGDMMVPALKRVFPRVDVAGKTITVDMAALNQVAVREWEHEG